MKKFVNPLVFLLLIFTFSIFANAQTEWLGSYVFDEDGGRTTGGTAIFVSHQIDIRESDDGLLAMVQSNGYQTSKDLICTAKAEGAKLLIYFDSYGENNMFEPYKKGDLLLTLERKSVKNKPEILTFWGKFTPVITKNEKNGKVYFTKTKE